MICIDSNVLIYAFNESSAYHKRAQNFIAQQISSNAISICDISLIEFFQVITDNRRLEKAFTPSEANIVIDNIISNKDFNVLFLNNKITI